MTDKLQTWLDRISAAPTDDSDYNDFIDLLVECRIITEAAS